MINQILFEMGLPLTRQKFVKVLEGEFTIKLVDRWLPSIYLGNDLKYRMMNFNM